MRNWKHNLNVCLMAVFVFVFVFVGCGGTPEEKPTEQKYIVELGGGKKVEINYMAITADVPEYLSRFEPVFQSMAAGMPTAVHTINVEYGGTPYDGFVSVGSKTLKVHNNWISSVSDEVCFASLGSVVAAWVEMLNTNDTVRMVIGIVFG